MAEPQNFQKYETRNYCEGFQASDFIDLNCAAHESLCDLFFDHSIGEKNYVPSDILCAGTIPLECCEIHFDQGGRDDLVHFRIFVRPEYGELIHDLMQKKSFDWHPVGCGEVWWPNVTKNKLQFMFGIANTEPSIIRPVCYQSLPHPTPDYLTEEQVYRVYDDAMRIWYMIQVALLHPQVKEIFNVSTIGINDCLEKKSKRKQKRKTKYVRKITLSESFSLANQGGCGGRKFTCLAWYVIGHWRTYASGKRVFVRPYWKGPLRDTKKNAPGDDRERVI